MRTATRVALTAGTKLAKMSCRAMNMKSTLTTATQDGATALKRTVRKGLYVAQDWVDEAAFAIKRRPLKSAAIVAGVAFGLGAVTAAVAKRNCYGSDYS